MFIEKEHGIFQSQLLQAEYVIHAFTSRTGGDMRHVQPRKMIQSHFFPKRYRLTAAEQTHGAEVCIVREDHFGITIKAVDGLVYQFQPTETQPILLMVTADCVPLLFADEKTHTVAAGHAGWKGTLAGVSKRIVESMVHLGAEAGTIKVAMGPHIRSCCYDVDPERAQKFQRVFQDEHIVTRHDGKYWVDLELANREILISSGIKPEHIDIHTVCTASNPLLFYSYRNQTQPYGKQMAVIGLR